MLNHKAMLMTLSISQWTARKHDKGASAEVAKTHGAKDAGRFNKLLIDADALKPIASAANALREYHNNNTMPWTDDGRRLLPSALFMKYTQDMRQLRDKFEARVREFVNDYPALVQGARQRLGTLYDPQDYPVDISHKFAVSVEPEPVPDAADFRVDVGETEVNRVRSEIEESVRKRQEKALKDCWARIKEVVETMHSRLANPKAVFRDTLVENVRTLHAVLPAFNLSGDALLAEIHKDMDELVKSNPATLRNSLFRRREVADAAWKILQKIPSAQTSTS